MPQGCSATFPRTRKYSKKGERDSLIREVTRRVGEAKDTRKENVVQSQEVTFVLNGAGAGWEGKKLNGSCVNTSWMVIVQKDLEILVGERGSDVTVIAEHLQGDSHE